LQAVAFIDAVITRKLPPSSRQSYKNPSQKYVLEIFYVFGDSAALAFLTRIPLVWAAKDILHNGQIFENSFKIYF
jgi:hypothetical protein